MDALLNRIANVFANDLAGIVKIFDLKVGYSTISPISMYFVLSILHCLKIGIHTLYGL